MICFIFSIDTETYVQDFLVIDKDLDGSISYVELFSWIKKKATHDSAWAVFIDNPQVISVAHQNAARKQSGVRAERVVDLADFRGLLVQLFATSILWNHFKSADSWVQGGDVGNKQLNLEEFKMACRTLCVCYAGEELTDEQIQLDFDRLDTNMSSSIGFVEVTFELKHEIHSYQSIFLFL